MSRSDTAGQLLTVCLGCCSSGGFDGVVHIITHDPPVQTIVGIPRVCPVVEVQESQLPKREVCNGTGVPSHNRSYWQGTGTIGGGRSVLVVDINADDIGGAFDFFRESFSEQLAFDPACGA